MSPLKFLAPLLFTLIACGPKGRSPSTTTPTNPTSDITGDTPGNPNGIDTVADAQPCAKMDILFVIDNSASMSEEQSNLGANFPKFVDLINNYVTSAGSALDYRLAVTTTGRDYNANIVVPIFNITMPLSEKGENGAFQTGKDCNIKDSRKWMERTDGNVQSSFPCVANVGTGGPSFEMPLEGMKLALSDRVADGTNQGFLREDALLAIVMLTDEDDCSRADNNWTDNGGDSCKDQNLEKVEKYVAFLDQLKVMHGRWAASVIAGPGPGSCMSNFGKAAEASRLKKFISLAAPAGQFSSICAGDLTAALKEALDNFNAACESIPPIG